MHLGSTWEEEQQHASLQTSSAHGSLRASRQGASDGFPARALGHLHLLCISVCMVGVRAIFVSVLV